jgi:hypothetical protein
VKDFDEAPFPVIGELTQTCDPVCVRCRAGVIGVPRSRQTRHWEANLFKPDWTERS